MQRKSRKTVPSSRAAHLSSTNESLYKTPSLNYGIPMDASITSTTIGGTESKQMEATTSSETRNSSSSAHELGTSQNGCKPMLHPKRWSSRARSPHRSCQLVERAPNAQKRGPGGTWIKCNQSRRPACVKCWAFARSITSPSLRKGLGFRK